MKEDFYLDNAATTCVAEEVIQSIFETMENTWGNPSSLHQKGIEAHAVVEKARKTIADYINCKPSEIIFTSGACEANSLAILGYIRNQNRFYVSPLFTSTIEHKSIMSMTEDCNDLCDVRYVPVDQFGSIEIDTLDSMLKDYTSIHSKNNALVSIQVANSEIGTCQNIKELSEITHKHGGIFHCDTTQLFPYQRIDVKNLGIDMMSMSGQKIHTPKGIGFLYVKEGIELEPLIYGSQENNMRGGTSNVPYIVGLAKAIELLDKKFKNQTLEQPDIYFVRNYMQNLLCEEIGYCIINGAGIEHRLPNNINISFKGIESESLLLMLNQHNIYVSAGSACNSGDSSPSYVLQAINVPEDYIRGTIRITLPDDFTFDEADYVVGVIKDCVERLRQFGEK